LTAPQAVEMTRSWWLGQRLAAFDRPFVKTLPASDAPVVTQPGHRRGNELSPDYAYRAALPQPPHFVFLPTGAVTSLALRVSTGRPGKAILR